MQAINGAVRKNDCATAVRLARPLADKGNVMVGERVMGFCLGSKGMGIKKDAAEAAKWLAKAADQGDATAQLLLGLAYFSGNGVKKDGAEATKWCRKAADQGEPRAEYVLASAYEAGIGVPKDAAQALDWYRKALAHGYEQAKADIARLESSSGQGGSSAGQSQDATLTAIRDAVAKKDCSPVMSELRKLGEAGNSEAQIDLSNCLYYGWGVPKDLEGSALWTRKAAEQGESGAQYSLGWDYARGEGVQRDPFEAEKWLRKSAEKNNAYAPYPLGVLYFAGDGVTEDVKAAAEWWQKGPKREIGTRNTPQVLCTRTAL